MIPPIDNGSDDFQPPIEEDPPKDIFPSVPSHPLPCDLKHQHYPCDCPDGWESDDDIINDDTTTTDITSDSQPSIFFDNNSDREFDNDTTSKFIFDIEAKTATDDDTDATESIVFDDKPIFDDKTDKKSNDDDDSEFYLYKGPSAPFMLRKFPRDIYNTTTADKAKPMDDATTTTNPIIFDKKPN